MSTETNDHEQMRSLAAHLAEASASVDKDDLSCLAKMHGWCEALAGLTRPDGPCPDGVTFEKATSATRSLEALVLGEAEDPDTTLAEIRQTIDELALGDPPAVDSGAAAAPGAPPRETAAEAPAPAPDHSGDEPGPAAAEEATSAEPQPQESAYDQQPLVLNENELEFVKGFVEEASEHIEAIECAVLEVEQASDDSEKINDLFRPFHTIKGMAGFLNLRDINCLTHEVETLLDQGRRGERTITPGLIDLIFDVVDILKSQVAAVGAHLANPQGDTVPQPPVVEMIGHLRAVVAGRIELVGRDPAQAASAEKVGEYLVEQGSVAGEAVEFAVDRQQAGQTAKKTGELLIEQKAVTPRQVSQAIRAQKQPEKTPGPAPTGVGDQSVRIDTAKLDSLVDMVGELVIAQTLVSTNRAITDDPKLNKDVGQVTKIVRDVQEVAMGMRMIPIGSTFQRMARLVRDVSRKAGKQVTLHISGEDTELDKNVIQQIGDPLVHMVRNAVDHGIESPEQRRAAGKDPNGNVYLSAYHHGGNIAIEIRDDGQGLDRDRLIAKAVERGLLESGDELSDQQAFNLVFAAGFSTAEQVTDISGRGVGMDVVKRNIEQLRGRVEITSEKGQGSTFTIRLPLTLAIIDGMAIRVASERFIIPTINIEQSLRPQRRLITSVQHRGEVLQVRGELVPLVQLGELFGVCGRIDPCEAMVVIAQCDDRKIGIVVDALIGQQQVVIKTLGERFKKLRGIAGAAILGDGRVGLILEMLGLETAHNTRSYGGARGADSSVEGAGTQDADADCPPEGPAAEAHETTLEAVLA